MIRNQNYSQENSQMTREAPMFPAGMQYLPVRRKKTVGRWTTEEHAQFINCLKTYGKDWDKLDEMIPTRNSLQIRSHCQKYFNRIKKDYNTNNPMEYILKNMCDVSPFYKFDKSKFDKNKEEDEAMIPAHQNYTELKPAPTPEGYGNLKPAPFTEGYEELNKAPVPADREQSASRSREQTSKHKKRHIKYLQKYHEDSSSSGYFKSKADRSCGKSEYYQVSLSKMKKHAEKIHRSKTEVSDKAELITKIIQARKEKYARNTSENTKSSKGTKIELNNTSMLIQGNKIEMKIPCKMIR